MKSIKRILLATDFNADTTSAVEFVSSLARQLDAELHLIHVTAGSPQNGQAVAAPPVVPDDIQGQLDHFTMTASLNRVTTVAAVRTGRPAEEIAA
jgi:hypothetical protein